VYNLDFHSKVYATKNLMIFLAKSAAEPTLAWRFLCHRKRPFYFLKEEFAAEKKADQMMTPQNRGGRRRFLSIGSAGKLSIR
jgi:hypothetical protein